MTIVLNEDQLDALIRWYDRTVYTTKDWLKHPDLDEQFFHENGLIEPVYDMIGGSTLTRGYILSRKGKEIVKRREPLRLVLDLMSRVDTSLPTDDMADIVKRIPFAELPEILSCDDEYIRELAERKVRKRKFFASMR